MSKVLIVKNRDKRMKYLKDYLLKYVDVIDISQETELNKYLSNNNVKHLILPIRGMDSNLLIDGTKIYFTNNYFKMAKGKTIYTGLINECLDNNCKKNDVRLITYLTEEMAIKNNYITTEGIIEALVNNSDKAIFKSKILIIGYGKLGTICANILKSLKANISILCRHKKDILHAKINDLKVFLSSQLISIINHYDFIINTVPYPIINHNIIKKINNSELLIIDVSSSPYGLDHEYAKSRSINTLLLPGIPGKIAPKTAGELIGEFIYQDICGGEK